MHSWINVAGPKAGCGTPPDPNEGFMREIVKRIAG